MFQNNIKKSEIMKGIFVMKKIIIALLVCSMLATMTSCGDGSKAGDSSIEENVTPITAEDLKGLIISKKAFEGALIDCTSIPDYALDNLGIASDLYSTQVFLEVEDTTNSYETICVFVATSDDNANTIKEKLDSYIASLKAQFSNYNQTIIDMVNKSVVKVDGNKAYLIISPNVAEIEKVITDNLDALK